MSIYATKTDIIPDYTKAKLLESPSSLQVKWVKALKFERKGFLCCVLIPKKLPWNKNFPGRKNAQKNDEVFFIHSVVLTKKMKQEERCALNNILGEKSFQCLCKYSEHNTQTKEESKKKKVNKKIPLPCTCPCGIEVTCRQLLLLSIQKRG